MDKERYPAASWRDPALQACPEAAPGAPADTSHVVENTTHGP
ncbi:hypothetical protein ACGF7W_18970 [Streptomyces sp. NPDC048219]